MEFDSGGLIGPRIRRVAFARSYRIAFFAAIFAIRKFLSVSWMHALELPLADHGRCDGRLVALMTNGCWEQLGNDRFF